MSFTIRKWNPLLACAAVLVLVALMSGRTSFAYSVLTHEEIVDLAWTPELRPLLLHRFPDLTEDQIKEAHAYAYGGSVIQDLGYYPFGNKEFSNTQTCWPNCPRTSSMGQRPNCAPTSSPSIPIFRSQSRPGKTRLAGKVF
jgi:uncharacterized protein (DUF433 family)